MIKLSRRLEAIAQFLPQQMERFIDVGCDHALLPLALIQSRRLNHALAIDLNSGPLIKARANAERYALSDKIDIIQNDGLKNIALKSSDTILIAGLGGYEIADILEESRPVASLSLYIQVNWHWQELRKRIARLGWELIDETAIDDGKRVYNFLRLNYKGEAHELSDLDAYLGPRMKEKLIKRRVNEAEIKLLFELLRVQRKKALSNKIRDVKLLSELEALLKPYL